jgi:hypothetical protein
MWWKNAQIYHIYPLGFCGSPRVNQAAGPGENRFPSPAAAGTKGSCTGHEHYPAGASIPVPRTRLRNHRLFYRGLPLGQQSDFL